MNLRRITITTAFIVLPFALPFAKATIIPTAAVDYAGVVKQSEMYHLDRIDLVVHLNADQREQVAKLLDIEATRIRWLQEDCEKPMGFATAMSRLAEIELGTVLSLKKVLTPEQFSKLRPLVNDRRKEVIAMATAEVNTAWYEAAVDAGFNPNPQN